ncbi:putative B3 domain-containing protein Os08g0325100 [Triticum dicoccoides]|uniref:putative B3 domain-containing protein Os08g0325100 n=1 Tax=Triticum dicoccoides TaxID=85692 RepID=UPI000E7C6E76|nr:putative B3 domain-containing protein Os08g0325100 [Triticum dicoccoides]
MGCERCERRDELDYCNLDDREKYFLMFIVDDCGQEMIVPDEFLRRFRGEIPREIKLETRNGHSYTIGVAKYPDKLVLQAGWGLFVKTYDLRMDDCVVFRYKGNSQFGVIVFDRFGREKAFSVITDNAPPVQESHNRGTENVDRSHGHSQPMEVQSPIATANHSDGRPQPMRMQPPTENANPSHAHPQPMRMQPPTENLDDPVGFSRPMEMQPPTENVDHLFGHSQPMQMQPSTEAVDHFAQMQPSTEAVDHSNSHAQTMRMQPSSEVVDHSNDHAQTMQMQLFCRPTKLRQTKLQWDYSSKGNKTATSPSDTPRDSLSSEHDIEGCASPRYTLTYNSSLNTVQKEEIEEKVKSIHKDNPIFVAVMRRFNVTGTCTLTFSKKYVQTHVGDKERRVCLQRFGKRWDVQFSSSREVKRIVSGWRKFVKDNDVETGDICIFELLKIDEMCTMEVHIIHAKDFDRPSQIGGWSVEGRCKEATTKTVEPSHSRPQLVQMQLCNASVEDSYSLPQPMEMQSPSTERKIRVETVNSSPGNEGDSSMSEDGVTLTGCIGVHLRRIPLVQKKVVKQKVDLIGSEIPIYVLVMQKTNVTGRFTLSISKKYVRRHLGDEVRSIWLERDGERCQVTLGRKPQNNRVVGGWIKFAKENGLRVGDVCLLERLRHCKECTMKVHIVRRVKRAG